ncbi:FAD/NAD(P)-binding protein [Nonomuraea wenchangensis]
MGTIVVIGAGPAGTCVVDRICAEAPRPGGGRTVEVHVVDPAAPPRETSCGVPVHVHRDRAIGLAESAGRQLVRLLGGRTLEADAVVLAQDLPGPGQEHDLENVPAGEPVLVRGAGRAFTDLLAPLTVGRGGRFTRGPQGEPVYLPGGLEPLLYVGSRRGVPHHARPGYELTGEARTRRFPYEGDERKATAKELAYAYYRELFTAHPSRTRMTWAAFEAAFARAEQGGREMRALVTRSVPRFADRLHLDRLARPLHGMRFGDLAGLQRWMHGYLAADLERRADPGFSPDLALIRALRDARPRMAGDPWFEELFGLLADGPSLDRQAELHALARAGIVTFIGAEPRIEQDEDGWRASGPTVPGLTRARTLIEARRPPSGPDGCADPLLAGLYARGEARQAAGLLDVRLPDGRLVTGDGSVHGRRFALGSLTTGSDLPRRADAVARAVLSQVSGALVHAAA